MYLTTAPVQRVQHEVKFPRPLSDNRPTIASNIAACLLKQHMRFGGFRNSQQLNMTTHLLSRFHRQAGVFGLQLCRASCTRRAAPSRTNQVARSITSQAQEMERADASSSGNSAPAPGVSRRVQATDAPVIGKTKALIAGMEGVRSLAQGIVHWTPPQAALDAVASATGDTALSQYGPDAGMPALREALAAKLAAENGLDQVAVMVTAGANQAFTNLVLALLDADDGAVLFKPYYFNHLMAFQMSGGADSVVFGPCNPSSWHPDLGWLERTLAGPQPPRMVVLVNPCNPTGVLLDRSELERASELCAAAGTWLVVDNTYEHFTYDGAEHTCVSGPHVINVFSFSKAYGMMGWRCGYIAYPTPKAGAPAELSAALDKVQDTIPICPPQAGQLLALRALQEGRSWVTDHVAQLQGNREAVLDALSPLGSIGSGIADGRGAIYLWAALPPGCKDDEAVVAWLVRRHKVCIIPGSSCGAPGHVRAAFANLPPEETRAAAAALKAGLQQLVAEGPAVLQH